MFFKWHWKHCVKMHRKHSSNWMRNYVFFCWLCQEDFRVIDSPMLRYRSLSTCTSYSLHERKREYTYAQCMECIVSTCPRRSRPTGYRQFNATLSGCNQHWNTRINADNTSVSWSKQPHGFETWPIVYINVWSQNSSTFPDVYHLAITCFARRLQKVRRVCCCAWLM